MTGQKKECFLSGGFRSLRCVRNAGTGWGTSLLCGSTIFETDQARVTGRVCEKIVQNVAQYIHVLSKLVHNFYRRKNVAPNMRYFCNGPLHMYISLVIS
jgi:hypothetical protein